MKLVGNQLELIIPQTSASSLNLKKSNSFSPQTSEMIELSENEVHVSILSIYSAPTKFTFEVSIPSKVFIFSAEDEKSRRQWVRLLKSRTRNRNSNQSIRLKRQTAAFKVVADNMKRRTVVLQLENSEMKGVDLTKKAHESVQQIIRKRYFLFKKKKPFFD